jgi:hypothetical protein
MTYGNHRLKAMIVVQKNEHMYLTGAIRFIGADDTDSMPTRVLACHQGKDPGCITQSFITTMFSMCSFFWTTLIAFNLVKYPTAINKSAIVRQTKNVIRNTTKAHHNSTNTSDK